jgi:hypothetical protein
MSQPAVPVKEDSVRDSREKSRGSWPTGCIEYEEAILHVGHEDRTVSFDESCLVVGECPMLAARLA